MLKRILFIGFWVVSILSVLAFEVYALKLSKKANCENLIVDIRQTKKYPALTSSDEIRTKLLRNYPSIEGQAISTIDLEEIEKKATVYNHVKDQGAFFYVNGNVGISGKMRKPIARIYNKVGQHFYLGEDTLVMPVSSSHSARVIVANGNLPKLSSEYFTKAASETPKLPSIYKKIYILASKIQNDVFLNALIDQIYIVNHQEIELIPKTGISTIILGDIDDLDNKMKRLKIFYIKGKEKINWNIYKSINLKYENQVVCTKK